MQANTVNNEYGGFVKAYIALGIFRPSPQGINVSYPVYLYGLENVDLPMKFSPPIFYEFQMRGACEYSFLSY